MRLLQEFLYDDRKMVRDVIDSGVPEMTYTEVSTLSAARHHATHHRRHR